MRQDLTSYSDRELSMHVFNTEDLYQARHGEWFTEILAERFVYTNEQYAVLLGDIADDREEQEA